MFMWKPTVLVAMDSDWNAFLRQHHSTRFKAFLISYTVCQVLDSTLSHVYRCAASIRSSILLVVKLSKAKQSKSRTTQQTEACRTRIKAWLASHGRERGGGMELGRRDLALLEINKLRRHLRSIPYICICIFCQRSKANAASVSASPSRGVAQQLDSSTARQLQKEGQANLRSNFAPSCTRTTVVVAVFTYLGTYTWAGRTKEWKDQ